MNLRAWERILPVVLGLVFFSSVLAQTGIEAQRRQLYETRAQLEAIERRLAGLRQQLENAERSIVEDEERLAAIRRLRNSIAQAQAEKEATIARIRRAMFDIHEQIEQRKLELAQRLITLYKYGRLFELELLLSARSLPDVYKRLYYLRLLSEADRARIRELQQLEADIRAQHDHFKYAAAALRQLQAEYDAKIGQLQADRQLKAATVRRVSREVAANEARAEQLAAAAAELERLIRQLEAQQPAVGEPGPPSTISGRLPWPVAGRVRLGFGEQATGVSGTKTRNSGIVIECTPGSPVRAVAGGRIAYAEEFMSYGNLVIIDHNDGTFSVYGNLRDIGVAVNDIVDQGEVVGSADATLYFELRHSDGPVDPLNYLK